MPPRSKSSKSRKAIERRERKLLEARIKLSQEKCDEALAFLEPVGRNAQPNYPKAMIALEGAIETYDANANAFFLLGECLRGQGEHEKAIEGYSQCLEKDVTHIRAMEGRAASYIALEKWSYAFQDYTSIISVEPENDHAYNFRGLCILSKRVPGLRLLSMEFNQCVSDFQTAIRLNEANYYAWTNLGKAYEEQGMLEEALEAYSSALRVKEEYHHAQLRRGCLALRIVESSWMYKDDEQNEESKQPASNNLTTKIPKTQKEVEAEVLNEAAMAERRVKEEKLLQNAIADLQGLMTDDANKLKYDPWLPLNLGSCFLLQKVLNKAEEEFRLVTEIVNARSQLVQDGEAEPIPDVESLMSVLNLRVEILKDMRSRRFLADRHQ
ncbi:putative Tetratricopeptide repeat [Trypanosoma vivax]|uniref:Uncharacterized protein n=1 Tax=Trypanosoma vivax (strain Y486) TaxID=1055687 RepID=G0UBM5_TRYVY|nr:putative Tetratricopeptide repeat [Trypanosoma vivax]CCC53222.1 conserved hypothetical protein [Trypanosoma vivax Y486]